MSMIPDLIRSNRDQIIERWITEARQCASARGLTKGEFEDIMPRFLSALADAGDDLGKFNNNRRRLVENHLSSRLRQGFDLAEIIEEFAILGRVISRIWEEKGNGQQPDVGEIERFYSELNTASAAVAELFRQHMVEDEQSDKRYTRLLQQIASEALTQGGQSFHERLEDVLRLIMQAMNAQAATLLLKDGPESETMTTAASVGDATGVLERYVTTPDPVSFAGRVAVHEQPTTLLDARTTELQVDGVLKRNGIHSLLGVRLPPHHPVIGVLYIGLSETRHFSARELQRIETLAARLTLHLNNAKVYDELRATIKALKEERALRELFVAVLAHDLRGPLNVAKMGSAMLVHQPEMLDQRRDLASKIDVNIDRAEKMIRDLLDMSRIRANEPIPLRLDECDLAGMSRLVVEELNTMYADRFVLKAGSWVRGVWDAEELRRALWNLAINAVKYGDREKPITISVQRSGSGAQISVHNYGSVIAPDAQAHLFDPFARMREARTSGRGGWGLGLTLVRGAAEAHGGKVTIESSTESGTTFTIHLPPDSRPYQVRPSVKAS
jgi:signal transduction histidine kinase